MIGLDALFFDHGGRRAGRRTRVIRVVVTLGLTALLAGAVLWLHARAAAVRRWPVVPCTIQSSGVDDAGDADGRDRPYRPAVTFAFTVDGQEQLGHRLRPDASDGRTADAADAYAVADALPVGAAAACYVDPADPGQSVLVRPVEWWEPWAVPMAVAGSAAVVWFYCLPQLRPPRPAPPPRWTAGLWGAGLLVGFGAATVQWWVVPIVRTVASARWPAVPCVVESSAVQRHELHGEAPVTVYRTDVLYRYDLTGRTYHSNCYSLTELQSPARAGRTRAAAGYPAGSTATCYVDPADPWSATLTRHLSPTAIFGVIPALLAGLGGLMALDAGRGRVLGGFARLVRRSRWTLTILSLAVAGVCVWAVFARP